MKEESKEKRLVMSSWSVNYIIINCTVVFYFGKYAFYNILIIDFFLRLIKKNCFFHKTSFLLLEKKCKLISSVYINVLILIYYTCLLIWLLVHCFFNQYIFIGFNRQLIIY